MVQVHNHSQARIKQISRIFSFFALIACLPHMMLSLWLVPSVTKYVNVLPLVTKPLYDYFFCLFVPGTYEKDFDQFHKHAFVLAFIGPVSWIASLYYLSGLQMYIVSLIVMAFIRPALPFTHLEGHWSMEDGKKYFLLPPRFMQYMYSFTRPASRHTAHVWIHHPENLSVWDLDETGTYKRDDTLDVIRFICDGPFSSMIYPFFYFAKRCEYSKLGQFTTDTILTACIILMAFKFGTLAGLIQLVSIIEYELYHRVLVITLEHPFYHKLDGTYDHPYNSVARIENPNTMNSHVHHHAGGHHTKHINVDPEEMVQQQINTGFLMMHRLNIFTILWMLCSKRYDVIVDDMLYWYDVTDMDLDDNTKQRYMEFKNSVDEVEIMKRLQPIT